MCLLHGDALGLSLLGLLAAYDIRAAVCALGACMCVVCVQCEACRSLRARAVRGAGGEGVGGDYVGIHRHVMM